MASDYTEVLLKHYRLYERIIRHFVDQGSCTDRKESFYAKIKVSAFVNFEVDRLRKNQEDDEKLAI